MRSPLRLSLVQTVTPASAKLQAMTLVVGVTTNHDRMQMLSNNWLFQHNQYVAPLLAFKMRTLTTPVKQSEGFLGFALYANLIVENQCTALIRGLHSLRRITMIRFFCGVYFYV